MAFRLPTGKQKRTNPPPKISTIREFDGGWNVVDHELNLTPKFSVQQDNIMRGPDGSQQVRYGTELNFDFMYDETAGMAWTDEAVTIDTTLDSKAVRVNKTAHGLKDGELVTITNLSAAVGGIDGSHLSGERAIRWITANIFDITADSAATSTVSAAARTISGSGRRFVLPSRIINGTWFQGYLTVVSETGQIARVDYDGNQERIWDRELSAALSGAPNGWSVGLELVTFSQFGGRLHVYNGVDKPLEIDYNRDPGIAIVQYLADPSTGSNADVPAAQFAVNNAGYHALAGTDDNPTRLDLSAKLTSSVFATNPIPDDAVDIDMSKVTNTVDPVIRGLGVLRDKLIVAFNDAVSIGVLGTYTDTLHEPSFKDQVSNHGTVSHRSIVSLGDDMFMCDRSGVPSLAQSQLSNAFVPERVSDLIEPELYKNLSRLEEATLRNKVFAVFNPRERQYMLFMPKYEEIAIRLPADPIIVSSALGSDKLLINIPAHELNAGEQITITGSTNVGTIDDSAINKTWTIAGVIDSDFVYVQNETEFAEEDIVGGGSVIDYTPINNETLGYVLNYNKKARIKSWARFREMNWDWGAVDIFGTAFFGKNNKVYKLGSSSDKLSADGLKDYDYFWDNEIAIAVGDVVHDRTTGVSWEAVEAHTTPVIGSLEDDRLDHTTRWKAWGGRPITFAWEWPWVDFDRRIDTKSLRGILPDTDGRGQYTIQVFVDNIYKDGSTGELNPVREMNFVGSAIGGYGRGDQPYGGGRRSKEQLLWALPVLGKLIKLRFVGETTEPLRFVAVSIAYQDGSIKR